MLTGNDILKTLTEIKQCLPTNISLAELDSFALSQMNLILRIATLICLLNLKSLLDGNISLEIYLENIFKRKIDLITVSALKDQIKDQILNQVKYI
jgi:uncharacterized protein